MKAKALTTILAAAIVLTITGCGSTAEPIESDESPPLSSVTESAGEPTSEDLSYLDNGEVLESIIVLNDGRGLPLYSGSYENGRCFAETVSEYKSRLGENVNVYSLVIPTAAAFYLPEQYYDEGVSAREPPHIENINNNLSGVIPVDAYSALEAHKNEDIFFKTDHHWTQLGAYYAAEKFAETALVPFDGLSEYDKKERSSFSGNLFTMMRDSQVKVKPDAFVWYEPKREVTTTAYDIHAENGTEQSYFRHPSQITDGAFYIVFHNGAITHTSTGLETGRRLMIIGDSLPWALAPCLFGSFDDVWLFDYRGFEGSLTELAKDKGITDVLFCESISVAVSDSSYKVFAGIM